MSTAEIGKKVLKLGLLGVLLAVLLIVGYTYAVLNWSYSKGERIGYVQKFSEKGWLCKTWEAELQMLPVPGAMPEKFLFTVREDTVISGINASLGKKVAISYQQHKGIPTSCFGETEHFAVNIRVLE